MPKTIRTARAAAMSALMAASLAAPVYAAPSQVTSQAPATRPTKVTQPASFMAKADAVADSTAKTTKKVWTFLNREQPHPPAIYEVKRKATRLVSPVNKAMGGGLTWTDNTMSRPALFVMLAFLALLTLLGMSSATDRTGNYH